MPSAFALRGAEMRSWGGIQEDFFTFLGLAEVLTIQYLWKK